MKSKYAYPLVGILSLAAAAWAQEANSADEAIPSTANRTLTPVTVTAGASLDDAQATALDRFDTEELEAKVAPVQLDDSVPLPIRAVVEEGVDGDRIVSPAKGDPFFLSFIAGPYTPPANELADPSMLTVQDRITDARPGNETYGMVMFQKRITEERIAQLKQMDCRILGFHPHYTLKVAIPMDRILDVSTLDFVRWVGTPRDWQKVHPSLRSATAGKASNELQDMYISVYESDMNENSTVERFGTYQSITPDHPEGFVDESEGDLRSKRFQSNGWMHQHLESLGLIIREYRPDIDVFVVSAPVASIEAIVAQDYVQFVEEVPHDEMHAAPVHDESIPMVAGDQTRINYDGSTNSVAHVGIVDSGVETAHTDINVFGRGWNCTTESSPWDDNANGGGGHGTHVTGTILGNGTVEADHAGMAPGLATWSLDQAYYNYRRFPNPCSVSLSTILNQMDTVVGAGTVPHVVNHSWGSTLSGGAVPTGTEADARTVDNHVFNTGQVQVWSAGNTPTTLGIQSAAKNALTVGNALDYFEGTLGEPEPGDMWTTSGRGPTSDNRWKPNLNAPGRIVSSCAANNNSGYLGYSGTSMSAPHVTGLIAQLVDHYAFLQDREPAEIAARLMATAQTNDNVAISVASDAHLDNFGAGRINAYRAHWDSSGWDSLNWSPVVSSGNSTFGDFTVPANTSRLVIVMHYNEVAASAGAGSALVNDWDLWIDRDPIDPASNTGEYFVQQSSVDNTEMRIITNPAAGPWRWKAHPQSTTSSMHLGVTVLMVTDDVTPTNTVTVTASDMYVQPGEQLDVDVNVAAGDYFSAATFLDIDGNGRTVHSKATTMADGTASDLSASANPDDYITLGDVRVGQSRNATYTISFPTEGNKTQTIQTRSENAAEVNPSVAIVVDGTEPGAVSNLTSTSHTPSVWSNDPTVDMTWTAASDDRSGVQGYGTFISGTATGSPGAVLDIGAVTSDTTPALATTSGGHYYKIRTVDNSDNWDADFVAAGPYLIDTIDPSNLTLVSSTLTPGDSQCGVGVTVTWSTGSDAHSGIAGYGASLNTNPTAAAPAAVTTTLTSANINLPVGGNYYLHVRAIDNAGNAGATLHLGPFTRTAVCGVAYCAGNLNSTGFPATLYITGSDRVSDNDLTLNAESMPLNNFGYFICGTAEGPPIVPPGSQGTFCLGGAFGRYNAISEIKFTGATGAFDLDIDLTSMPTNPNQAVMVGQSWSFQAWHRDQNPFNTSNFTNGVTVTFK